MAKQYAPRCSAKHQCLAEHLVVVCPTFWQTTTFTTIGIQRDDSRLDMDLEIIEFRLDVDLEIIEFRLDMDLEIIEFRLDMDLEIIEFRLDMDLEIIEFRLDMDLEIIEFGLDFHKTSQLTSQQVRQAATLTGSNVRIRISLLLATFQLDCTYNHDKIDKATQV